MKPVVIQFNGLGQPTTLPVTTGHVAILVQSGKKEVVRIELLPPDDYGPRLHHAKNQALLAAEVDRYWSSVDSRELSDDRGWIIDCPEHIARNATFDDVA